MKLTPKEKNMLSGTLSLFVALVFAVLIIRGSENRCQFHQCFSLVFLYQILALKLQSCVLGLKLEKKLLKNTFVHKMRAKNVDEIDGRGKLRIISALQITLP